MVVLFSLLSPVSQVLGAEFWALLSESPVLPGLNLLCRVWYVCRWGILAAVSASTEAGALYAFLAVCSMELFGLGVD